MPRCPFCGAGSKYTVMIDDFGDHRRYKCFECSATFISDEE